MNQAFPDPSAFTSEADFTYAAKTASVFKKVIAEILMWVQQQEDMAQYLQDKEAGKVVNKFRIS